MLAAAAYVTGLWTIPHWWCGREASRWFAGDEVLVRRLAHTVTASVGHKIGREDFHTGNAQFNGEWLFGTYMMAGMGFGQMAVEHPAMQGECAAAMKLCIDRLLSSEVRTFDKETWKSDPLETLAGSDDHAAYLGYLNLLLSLHRRVDPHSEYTSLNDQITAALVRRLEASPILLLHSYPNEVYPVDNCAAIGSIGLYDQVTGVDHRALLNKWTQRCREKYVDAPSGLIYQCVDPRTGAPADLPRGSGTTLGLYFLSFADPKFSGELFTAVRRQLADRVMGFGVIREYPRGVTSEDGDIDSGPVVFGYGVSATGFGLAGSRIFGDKAQFNQLYSTAYLVGAPVDRGVGREFVMGGPLGNAIMFAMLTAQPLAEGRP